MHKLSSVHFVAALVILAALCGCGGGGGGGNGNGGGGSGGGTPEPVLSVTPAASNVFTSETVTLVAAGGTPPYTYIVTAGAGTVTAAGIYTAAPTAGTATVTVTDAAGRLATATITASARAGVAIVPGSITMPASSGQSYAFAGQGGVGSYQFQLLSGPGSITPNGVYTAGTRSGTATIQVTDQQGKTATATVKSVFVRTNGPVYSAATDGTSWYLGGSFSAVNAYQTPHLAALDPAGGSPNLACDLQDGFDDVVLTTVSDGTFLYVGGRFSHYRGVEIPGGLVKIDPVTCQIITTFFRSTDQAISTSALFVSGNSLLVNAYAPRYRGISVATSTGHTLMRLDTTTGNLDANFHVTLPIGELPRIFATSTAVYAGIFKLDPVTGAQDAAFQLSFANTVNAYAASGNSLYVGGFFGGGQGNLRKVDARTGAVDPAFDSGLVLDGNVYDLALAGNSLYVAGAFTNYGNDVRNGLAKVDAATGALDMAFAPAASFLRNIADGGAHAVLYDSGSLYVTGNFMIGGTTPAMHIARLDGATGAIDTTFTRAVGLSDTGYTLTRQGNTLFVGGRFVAYRGTRAPNLAKLNIADGVADPAFTGIGTDGRISALALHDGFLYLGGEFSTYNGAPAQHLAKVSASTATLDTGFTQPTASIDQPVSHLAVTDSGLFISGNFVVYRGIVQHGFAKLNLVDGSVDTAFVNGFADGFAGPIAVHGSYVYTSSTTTSYGSLAYPAINRIDVITGAADAAFPGVPAGSEYNVAITFSGNTGYASISRAVPGSGSPVSNIVKFDGGSGTVDTGFSAAVDQVFTPILALRGVGSSLYAAATPTQYASDGYGYFLTKLDAATGAMDTTFSHPSATANGSIRALESTGTDLWVAGEFSQYRGAPAYFFVRVDPATGAISEP